MLINVFSKSIFRKLIFTLALGVFFSAFIYAVCMRASLRESLIKQIHNELEFRYSLITPLLNMVSNENTEKNWSTLKTRLILLSNSEGGRVKYWILSDKKEFQVGGLLPEVFGISHAIEGFREVKLNTPDKCPLFVISRKIKYNNDTDLLLVISIDSTPYMGTLNEFTRILILITTVGILFVIFWVFFITRKGIEPINLLSEQAHNLAPGITGQRLESSILPQELRGLADAFNGVLERQEKALEQLESFNADVAHELRTPLATISGQTQLILSRKSSLVELEDCLISNLEEVNRMTSIVNDMLFLSHAQTGKYLPSLTKVSLLNEAQRTAEYTEPSFTDRNLQLVIHGEASVHVDKRLFSRALANLLENSARYADENSKVEIRISCNDRIATVEVINEGFPIAPIHLERLFERFYRVDNARKHSDVNHGLGLSIVKAIALIHGGKVFATSLNGVNTFGFTLADK